jgi:hypothetical protein
LGAFAMPDVYLTAAAIGAMGIRVAEWWVPGDDYTADQIAETYAELALKLVAV